MDFPRTINPVFHPSYPSFQRFKLNISMGCSGDMFQSKSFFFEIDAEQENEFIFEESG